jgi:T5SS/PEP-CTERM-associated repeat protein
MKHSLFRPALFFTALSAFLLLASPQNAAAAALTNGGFETGSFSPWVVSEVSYTTNPAPAFVRGASFTNAMGVATNVTPAEGSFQAVLNAPTSGTTRTPDLETFLGLQEWVLDPLFNYGNSYFNGGSAIKQTFDVRDGSVISFQWNFLPNGTNSSADQNDSGFFTLHAAAVTNSTNYTVLSTTALSGGVPTGYQPYTTGPLTAGSYLLGFSAFDQQAPFSFYDAQQPTLLIDAVTAYVPNLYVGSNSSGVTTNFTSGTHYYENTYVGFSAAASNNTLSVSGAGTVLTNYSNLYVGFQGSGNSLSIADGGTVANTNGFIGLDGASSNNSVLVTGANSLWTNSGSLAVGIGGSSNSLVISNGGRAANTAGAIGADSSSLNNSVVVTGTNSTWTNSAELYVGYDGSSNNLVISNGGTVANTDGYIGYAANSANNSVLVTGTNSAWTNTGSLYVGVSGSGSSLVISNGGAAVSSVGFIGNSSTSSNNSVLVNGAGSLWTNGNRLTVGNEGSSNSLVISNGGTVASREVSIGLIAGSSNNSVLVTGTNSILRSADDFYVGDQGSGNSLVISNGGTVEVVDGDGRFYIGAAAESHNNSVLVTGAGSTLAIVEDDLEVSSDGSNSILTVTDGGTVNIQDLRIANDPGSSGTVNIGRFGTNDTGGTLIAETIRFGQGTGVLNFNQSDAVTISSQIRGPLTVGQGTINQLGSGTTTLSATNSTFTGATTVEAGKLIVNGSIAGSTVTVNNGGTLAGSGTVGGIVLNLGSTLSPGNSPGTLNVAGISVWNAGANYNWQIYDTALGAGTGWDLVNATGTLDLTALTVGSEFNINLWSLSAITPDASGNALNFDPNQNYTWTILTAAGGISGFTGSSQFDINIGAFNGTGGFANALNGGSFSIAQSLDGKDLNLVFTAAGGAAVPEPGTWAAAALLVGGAAFMRWRKRVKVA